MAAAGLQRHTLAQPWLMPVMHELAPARAGSERDKIALGIHCMARGGTWGVRVRGPGSVSAARVGALEATSGVA